jgi:hypothetical protein
MAFFVRNGRALNTILTRGPHNVEFIVHKQKNMSMKQGSHNLEAYARKLCYINLGKQLFRMFKTGVKQSCYW